MALGLWTLVDDRRELRDLRRESDRLGAIVGKIDTEDPSRVHVVLVADDGPGELLWRVFLPAGQAWATIVQSAAGGKSTNHQSASNAPTDMLLRYGVMETEQGWMANLVHTSGSSSHSLQDEVGEFLDEHWDELRIRIAGSEGQLDLATDEVVTLLSIELPDELAELAETKLSAYIAKRWQEAPVITIEIGSDEAFALRQKRTEDAMGESPR
jgi:hypothetical protein